MEVAPLPVTEGVSEVFTQSDDSSAHSGEANTGGPGHVAGGNAGGHGHAVESSVGAPGGADHHTAAGLFVTIPTHVVCHFLEERLDEIALVLKETATYAYALRAHGD